METNMKVWNKMIDDHLNDLQTDSDIEDFACENMIPTKYAFQYLAELRVKDTQCEGCKNADYFPDLYPCCICSRNKKDYYQKRGEEE